MVLLLIDNSIIDYDKVNNYYFSNQNTICINSNIGIIKVPYYENSRHKYRDLLKYDKTDIDLISKKHPKEIRYNTRANKFYYNPKLNYGKIINYEYIPTNIKNYYKLPYECYISRIIIWTSQTINKVWGFIKIRHDILSKKYEKLEVVVSEVKKHNYFTEMILLPKFKYKLSTFENYYIDLGDIFNIKNNKFIIECSLI